MPIEYSPSGIITQNLLEILNERETYWISFYKTNDYGLNSTRGGA